MKRERERKEQENKKNQKVEFHSGGTQPGIVTSAPKPNIPIPGKRTLLAADAFFWGISIALFNGVHMLNNFVGVPALVAGGLPSATDAGVRDGRPNKKTKWDKVQVFAESLYMLRVNSNATNRFNFSSPGGWR